MRPSEALAAHRDELRQLISRYNVTHPRVFGSVLTGTDDEESDLDLLVNPTERTSLFTLGGLQDGSTTTAGRTSIHPDTERPAREISRQGPANSTASMKRALRIEDYLQHIAEAIDRITDYIQGIDGAAALERDHKIRDAVIRNIEIIGEAANKIQKQSPGLCCRPPFAAVA